MTVMARFGAPNWTLNSNDWSPYSSLPLISTPGGSRAAFGYSSALDLGPFYFKLRVDALFSCSQALNRADFEAERQTSPNFEPPTSDAIPNFKSTAKLRVDASQGCFQALNRADFQLRAAANFESRISSRRHRISAPRTSNQAANFLSTTSPTAPSVESRAANPGELRIS